jgi:hypothetical protein
LHMSVVNGCIIIVKRIHPFAFYCDGFF